MVWGCIDVLLLLGNVNHNSFCLLVIRSVCRLDRSRMRGVCGLAGNLNVLSFVACLVLGIQRVWRRRRRLPIRWQLRSRRMGFLSQRWFVGAACGRRRAFREAWGGSARNGWGFAAVVVRQRSYHLLWLRHGHSLHRFKLRNGGGVEYCCWFWRCCWFWLCGGFRHCGWFERCCRLRFCGWRGWPCRQHVAEASTNIVSPCRAPNNGRARARLVA